MPIDDALAELGPTIIIPKIEPTPSIPTPNLESTLKDYICSNIKNIREFNLNFLENSSDLYKILDGILENSPQQINYRKDTGKRTYFYLENEKLLMHYGEESNGDKDFFVRFNDFNPYLLYRGKIQDPTNFNILECNELCLVFSNSMFEIDHYQNGGMLISSISIYKDGTNNVNKDICKVDQEWFENGTKLLQKAAVKYNLNDWYSQEKKSKNMASQFLKRLDLFTKLLKY